MKIKFRGKRIDNGAWIYGYYVLDPKGRHRIYYQPFNECTSNTYFFVRPETVGQFTGLIDKNGKEIFEGDIVTGWTDKKEPVEYQQNKARFTPIWLQLWNNSYRDLNVKAIGNIHDNKELIESK